MKRILLLTSFLISTVSAVSYADAPGPFGLGFVLGDPTGLSANYWKSSERSVDAALAWNFGNETGVEFHADYLWHRHGIFHVDTVPFSLLYGLGGRMFMVGSKNNESSKIKFGPRLPLGIETSFKQKAIEVFGEIALILNVIPATSADIDFGLGVRVYF